MAGTQNTKHPVWPLIPGRKIRGKKYNKVLSNNILAVFWEVVTVNITRGHFVVYNIE